MLKIFVELVAIFAKLGWDPGHPNGTVEAFFVVACDWNRGFGFAKNAVFADFQA
jgi:hypothetical protein